MALFNKELFHDAGVVDSSHSSSEDDDREYRVHMELDRGDPDDIAADIAAEEWERTLDRCSEHEVMGDRAPVVTECGPSHRESSSAGVKVLRGRGPTKSLRATEPMYLEYNALGQPCGKWRRKYGTHLGLCVRKLSILHSWNEVPAGVKQSLWDDTRVRNSKLYCLFHCYVYNFP